ncbi:pregnancy-specific beta-1-glycoprotein 2-like [Crotalus adamanteus]|uniref:Pregnancy-specific beta-1-glycoprotein 2-like n=1 Tax=Crotalus adamanteus TaxID=8729 RepID=A0AAW1AXZ6_CROAD
MNSIIACLLSSYLVLIQAAPNATGNATIDLIVEPEFPVVGVTVFLKPKTVSEKITSCSWARGEDATYTEILVYELRPAPKIHKKAGYNTRHIPGKDCSLSIKNVSKADMDVYILQRNASTGTAIGKIYLLVIKENEGPEKRKGLSTASIAVIFVGCLLGTALVVAMISYQVWKDSAKR